MMKNDITFRKKVQPIYREMSQIRRMARKTKDLTSLVFTASYGEIKNRSRSTECQNLGMLEDKDLKKMKKS